MSCSGPGADGKTCGRPVRSRGHCSGHAWQRREGKELTPLRPKARPGERPACRYDDCFKPSDSHGLCWGHYEQHRRGQELRPLRSRRPTGTHFRRDEHGRKLCPECDTWKPVDEFAQRVGRADGCQRRCRECVRWATVLARFAISPDQYAEMLVRQGGGCAICRRPPAPGEHLAIDHDHTCCPGRGRSCGQCIRGLLCTGCNTALGLLDDDVARLARAAEYLTGAR